MSSPKAAEAPTHAAVGQETDLRRQPKNGREGLRFTDNDPVVTLPRQNAITSLEFIPPPSAAVFGRPLAGGPVRDLQSHVVSHWLTWRKMMRIAGRWLPSPKLRHPYPDWRFDVMTRGGARCASASIQT
jgi:hypothetical protein